MAHDHAAPHSDERRDRWDRRHADRRHTHHSANADLVPILSALPPGRALDLGAGTGRHAIWLAERGWDVTAVDFSRVGLALGEQEARGRGLAISWVPADVRTWHPDEAAGYDLVLVSFLHLPEAVLDRTASWLAPHGRLVVIGHALRNLTDGVGGPSDPALLYTEDGLREAAAGLTVLRCAELTRPADGGEAIDLVLVARKPD